MKDCFFLLPQHLERKRLCKPFTYVHIRVFLDLIRVDCCWHWDQATWNLPAHNWRHFAGLAARIGVGVTSFSWSRDANTLCQRAASFLVSRGSERSE